jgi:hypothetical protein
MARHAPITGRQYVSDLRFGGPPSRGVGSRPSDHPHGQTLKSGPRRVHIGSTLDRLYGDYVWMLCERGADLRVQDWHSSYVFVNTSREPLFAPMSPA